MKRIIIPLSLSLFIISPAMADKPQWSDKGEKHTEQQVEQHKEMMRDKMDEMSADKQKMGEHTEQDREKAEKMKQKMEQDHEKAEKMKQEHEVIKSQEQMKETDNLPEEAGERKKWWQFF